MDYLLSFSSFESEKLFEIKGFTAQLCCSDESKRIAYALRHKAYSHSQVTPAVENKEGLIYDQYDHLPNTRTHLIWYEGRPIASVRSGIWSEKYKWTDVESVSSFKTEIEQHIGLRQNMLESSRYVVDPDIKGRTSLTAQLLMFRIQDLSSQVDQCPYILTSVRQKHVPFYKRMLAFQQISDTIEHDLSTIGIVLLMTTQEESRRIVIEKGMPPCKQAEVDLYFNLLNHYKTAPI